MQGLTSNLAHTCNGLFIKIMRRVLRAINHTGTATNLTTKEATLSPRSSDPNPWKFHPRVVTKHWPLGLSFYKFLCGVNRREWDMANAVKTEMQLYNSSDNWGRCLQWAYNYLMSVPATSVIEFSVAGVLCTNLHSLLADDYIDTLCFLRSY